MCIIEESGVEETLGNSSGCGRTYYALAIVVVVVLALLLYVYGAHDGSIAHMVINLQRFQHVLRKANLGGGLQL